MTLPSHRLRLGEPSTKICRLPGLFELQTKPQPTCVGCWRFRGGWRLLPTQSNLLLLLRRRRRLYYRYRKHRNFVRYFDPSLDPSSIHHPPTTMTMIIQRLGKEKGEEEKASTPNPKMNERHSDCCFHQRLIFGLSVNLGECGFGGKNDSHFGAYYLCFPPFRVLCHLNELT